MPGERAENGVDLSLVVSLDEIQKAFKTIQAQEDDVNRELDDLLSSQRKMASSLTSLNHTWSKPLRGVASQADDVANLISATAVLADSVSVKVKQLDLAKVRVSSCQQRVQDLIDLRLCSDGVTAALKNEDYELAAAHLHRFLNMDAASLAREGVVGGWETQDSLDVLKVAEAKVKQVIGQRFDEAVGKQDFASVERFFKLFPLVKMHDEGLEKFTKNHLCLKLVETSGKNLKEAVETPTTDPRHDVIFADALTLLFEGLARTVEIHQPLIETYYGPGRLMSVMRFLQTQCDHLAEDILAELRKRRRIDEKISLVRNVFHPKPSSSSLSASSSSSALLQVEKVEAKDFDRTLGEITLLLSRHEMYFKFVRKKTMADLEVASGGGGDQDDSFKIEMTNRMEKMFRESGLCLAMQQMLSDYILLEDYYMTQNVKKAIQTYLDKSLSEAAASSANAAGATNTDPSTAREEQENNANLMLDDVFFIVKKCVQRAIATQAVDGVCAVANNASSILESDLCGLLRSQLKLGFPSGYLDLTMNVLQTSFQQGYKVAAAQASGDGERQKATFLVNLNNADNAMDYVSRLTSSLNSDLSSLVSGRSQHEKDKVNNCLLALPGVAVKLRSVLDQGMEQLRQSVVKPRIKPWLESFVGGHNVDEAQYADFEANDPFVQNLIFNLDNLLGTFKRNLTTNNYEALVTILTTEVTLQLEKAVLKSQFSRLGGLLFDRELRALVSFLTGSTTWSVRDRFSRLTQMATVLNLESVEEVADVYERSAGGESRTLSPTEVRQLLGLRVDFSSEEIKRIRL